MCYFSGFDQIANWGGVGYEKPRAWRGWWGLVMV